MSELNYSQEELLKLNEAVMILRDNCRGNEDCTSCPFYNEDLSDCKLISNFAPAYWEEVL